MYSIATQDYSTYEINLLTAGGGLSQGNDSQNFAVPLKHKQ